MKTLLWLDDVRDPFDKDFTPYVALYNPFLNEPHKIVWVKNYNEFEDYLASEELPDAISFDHDLALEHIQYYFDNGGHDNPPDPMKANFKEETGMDCVKLLVGFCKLSNKKLPICVFHTANPIGKINMETYINNAKKHLGL